MTLLHLAKPSPRALGIDVTVLALGLGALVLILLLINAPAGPRQRLNAIFFPLFAGMILVQGLHVCEHVIQLLQVYAFGVNADDAMGLLGRLFSLQGTAEWLHLVFNSLYLVALYTILFPLAWRAGAEVPRWAFATFVLAAVAVETWHVVEHIVIISNVIRNDGCPCPGIGDRVLGITDIQLHFGYNVVAYAGTVIPFLFVAREKWRARPDGTATHAPLNARSIV
jgi:hypothetical protein